jgi:hypothetical protein
MQAMLDELLERSRRALAELDSLFNETKNYFDYAINGIAKEFELTEKEISDLFKFKETILQLLNQAREQARTRLAELVAALRAFLEGDEKAVTIEQRRKVLHVRPAGENWFVSAWLPPRGGWRFALHIHGVKGEAVFPDIVKWSPADLESAQAGWRASDEGCNWAGRPTMGTTHPWQVLAWLAARYGRVRIVVAALHLNKREPSLEWQLEAKDWVQQWRDKHLAREIAQADPLGLLTLYLGDGHRHPRAFVVSVGDDDEYYKITSVPGIVKKAYETGYGKLLDTLGSDKWLKLKCLTPKRDPVYAEFDRWTFWLCYSHSKGILYARTVTKSEEEARECAQVLAALGVQARIHKWLDRYWALELSGREVLKLAELFLEWRSALKELAEKRRIEPRWGGPVTRKLLELAGSPPLPWQNF